MRLHVSVLPRDDPGAIDATLASAACERCVVSTGVEGVDDLPAAEATHRCALTAGMLVRAGVLDDVARLVDAAPEIPLTYRVDRIERHMDAYRAMSLVWSGYTFDIPADSALSSRLIALERDRAIVPVGEPSTRWIRHYDRALVIAPLDLPRPARPPASRLHPSPPFGAVEEAVNWALGFAPAPSPLADNVLELLDAAGHHQMAGAAP